MAFRLSMAPFVCVYKFTATVNDFTMNVHFFNEPELSKSGPDHSMPSAMRHDWAIQVVHRYNTMSASTRNQVLI